MEEFNSSRMQFEGDSRVIQGFNFWKSKLPEQARAGVDIRYKRAISERGTGSSSSKKLEQKTQDSILSAVEPEGTAATQFIRALIDESRR